MSKVNVRLNEFFTSPGFVPVKVKSVLVNSLSVISGNIGILPGEMATRTDATGYVQIDLLVGRYEITAASARQGNTGLQYREVIDVPDDNLEYEHTELIVDGAGTFTPVIGNGSPDAAEAVAGLVKLAEGADVEAAARVVYTAAQVDALLGPLGGGSASLIEWTTAEAYELTAINYDSDGVVTTATVKWPDGSAGVFTVTVKNTAFLAVDAYTITHVVLAKTVTQATMTRDASGNITVKPALTVA